MRRIYDKRWYFIRNLIVILRSSGDLALLPLIRNLRRHEHPRVREEVLKTLFFFKDPEAERFLLDDLQSTDLENRRNAVQIAEMSRSPIAFRRLLEILDNSPLSGADGELKLTAVRTLGKIGNPDAFPHLERALRAKSFFNPQALSALKGEILRSLEFYPPRETRLFLKRSQRKGRTIRPPGVPGHGEDHPEEPGMNAVQKQSFGDFVRCAVTAISNGSLYSGDHPQVTRLCQKAIYHLQETMEGQAGISFMGLDGAIVCEGERIDDNLFMNRFAQTLKNKGVEHIEIQRGITCQELQAFITSLSKKKGGPPAAISAPHIRLGKMDAAMSRSAASDLRRQGEKEGLLECLLAELDLLKEIFRRKRQKNLRVVGIQEIVAALVDSVRQEAIPLNALIPIRNLDEYTFSHSLNVCILNLAQAMAMGIEGRSLHDIGIAALLHDIGKLFIPEEVLNKPGKLNEEEWTLDPPTPPEGGPVSDGRQRHAPVGRGHGLRAPHEIQPHRVSGDLRRLETKPLQPDDHGFRFL